MAQFRRIPLEHQVLWSAEATSDGVSWSTLPLSDAHTLLNSDGSLTARVSAPNAIAARLKVRRIESGSEGSLEFRLSSPLKILRHPASQTVAPEGSVELSVTATGPDAVTYQWFHDGIAVAGATNSHLTLGRASAADAGEYTVQINSATGSVMSRAARLVVANPVAGDLVNFSVRGEAGGEGHPLIAGFVVSGGSKPLLIRAVGPGMPGAASSELMPDPRLDVHAFVGGQDTILASDDNWGATASERTLLTETFARTGAFPLSANSRDAAVLLTSDGVRTAHVNGAQGIALVEIYDAETTSAGHLVNVSARNRVGLGDQVLIAGFVINGNQPKRLLIRGVGPGLAIQGVSGVLADPVIELHENRGGVDRVFAVNDDWSGEPEAADTAQRVGAFALTPGSRDAVLVVTLPAGAYTAVVRGSGQTSGEALVEVYAAD